METLIEEIKRIASQAAEEKTLEILNRKKEEEENKEQKKNYQTAKNVCKEYPFSPQTLIRYRKAGKVKGYRIGGRIFYDIAEIEALLHKKNC